MTDLIKRDDALRIVEEYDVLHDHIKALPTIDPAAIREAALLEAAVMCDIAPPDEWNDYTKGGYAFAAEECKRTILALIGEKK